MTSNKIGELSKELKDILNINGIADIGITTVDISNDSLIGRFIKKHNLTKNEWVRIATKAFRKKDGCICIKFTI